MTRAPLHPFFLAVVPVLSMYAARLGQNHPEEPLTGAAIALLTAAAMFAVAAIAFRNARKGAIAVTALLAALLTYDAVFSRIDGAQVAGLTVGRQRYMLAGVVAVLLA